LALVAAADGAVDVCGDLRQAVLDRAAGLQGALDPAEAAAQGVAVAEHREVDLVCELSEFDVGHRR
jgi:hypothetical protein